MCPQLMFRALHLWANMRETVLDRCMQQPEHEEAEIEVIEEPAEENETTEVPVPKVIVPSPKCRESML